MISYISIHIYLNRSCDATVREFVGAKINAEINERLTGSSFKGAFSVSDQKPFYNITMVNHGESPLMIRITPNNQPTDETNIYVPAKAKNYRFSALAKNSPGTDIGQYRVVQLASIDGSDIKAELKITVSERPQI